MITLQSIMNFEFGMKVRLGALTGTVSRVDFDMQRVMVFCGATLHQWRAGEMEILGKTQIAEKKPWTMDEKSFLKAHRNLSNEQAAILLERTVRSVEKYRQKHNIQHIKPK